MIDKPSSLQWETLAAYFSGALSDVERVTLERRLETEPELAATVDRLTRALAVSGPVVSSVRVEPALARLRRELGAASTGRIAGIDSAVSLEKGQLRVGVGRLFKTQPLRRIVWSGVATVLVVCLLVSGWMVAVRHAGAKSARAASTYATANGERANIILPDGSMVTLNVASRLTVPEDYATGNRTIRLEGAAFFNVTHHDGKPFTVVAGTTTARVLGTSFVMRHYATDSTTVVAVQDGKVAIGFTGRHSVGVSPLILTVAQQIEVGPRGITRVKTADAAQFSFATGVLTLNDVPFPKAIAELDRWYDANIQLGDSAIATRRVTGEYAAGSLADLAAILGWTFDVRVVRNGRVLILYPR